MVEVKKKQKSSIPKKTVFSKIFGKERIILPEDHPMFCCPSFQGLFLDDLDMPIAYDPQYRWYYWITPKRETSIRYLRRCVLCWKKWPKDLFSEFSKELGKVVGHKIVYLEYDWSTLPDEFKSEEWWRKRGL